jgi:glycosyltransferase involved in cell wall biosynthesis
MLAGMAIAGTNVSGQRSVLAECGEGAELYEPGDHDALAAILERWRSDRHRLERAKRASLNTARHRWNWESERAKIVQLVHRALETRRAGNRHGSSDAGDLLAGIV